MQEGPMKRTVKFLGVTFGATALLSLGVACSTRQTPAPSVGATTPSSEIMTPPVGTTGQPGASMEMGEPGRPPAPPHPPGGPPTPEPGAFGSGLGEPGAPGEIAAQPRGGEKAVCEGIADVAKLHVEDVQNGVAIVAVPKPGASLAAVRDDAQRLQGAIHGAGPEARGTQPTGESCGLTQIGRLPSVTTVITEGPNAVRILMTTSNASEVKDLRKMGREQINSLNKGQK
jgi:hypothetical protein